MAGRVGHLIVIACVTLSLILGAVCAQAQQGGAPATAATNPSGDQPARVVQTMPIVIDPAKGTGTGTLYIYRPVMAVPAGAPAAPPAPASILRVGPFTSTATGELAAARATLAPGDVALPPLTAGPPVRAGPVLTLTWGERLVQAVTVEVTNLVAAGESSAEIFDDQRPIGRVRAVRSQVNFAVRLGASGEFPTLDFVDGEPAVISLVNADPIAYKVRLTVTTPRGGRVASEELTVPANGSAAAPVTLASGVFPTWFESAIKPRVLPASVTLELLGGDGLTGLPARTAAVQLRLSRWGPVGQAVASTLALGVLLLLGAFTSIFVTQIVPISIRRRELVDQLYQLRRRHRGVSRLKQTLLRATIRLELRRLQELLDSRWWYSVDINTVLADVARQISVLARQIDMLRQIDEVQEALEPCDRASIAKMRDVARHIAAATHLLETPELTEAQLAAAQREIDEARVLKAGCTNYSEQEKTDIRERGRALARELNALRGEFGQQFAAVPALAALVDAGDNPAAVTDYARHEADVARLELFAQYLRTLSARISPEAQAELRNVWPKFANLLSRDGPAALRAAGLLACQVREGVYTERLLKVLADRSRCAARIVVSPRLPLTYEAAQFSVLFDDNTLNTCAAREALICSWTFGTPPGAAKPVATEESSDSAEVPGSSGWSVPKYFVAAGTYGINVRFTDPLADGPAANHLELPAGPSVGAREPVELSNSVTVIPKFRGSGTWRSILEGGRLFFLVLIALAALLAGAREQVLKLDVVPAVLAVLAIGYGANGVKNLFVPPPVVPPPTNPLLPTSLPATPPRSPLPPAKTRDGDGPSGGTGGPGPGDPPRDVGQADRATAPASDVPRQTPAVVVVDNHPKP